MRIPRAALDSILDRARKGYPFEVCGILLGRGARVESAREVQNREEHNPRTRYVIAPEDLLRIQRQSREQALDIIGFYHSHPDHPAKPSETDRSLAAQGLSDGVFHMVVGVERGETATPTAWVFRDRLGGFEAETLEVE